MAEANEEKMLGAILQATPWRCFHCDFITNDAKEAEAHFGDSDDAAEFKPLCKWWQRMDDRERAEALQDTIQQLNDERRENMQHRTAIEGLEYQVSTHAGIFSSYRPFRHCSSMYEVFCVYDSMAGRALAAEEKLKDRRIERQQCVHEWCVAAFGAEQAASVPQRGLRMLEEAIEAAQAAGVQSEQAAKLLTYVYSRPLGELAQEIGGVGLTLLALGEAARIDVDAAEIQEIARVRSKPLEHFAARNQAKIDAGFLAAGVSA